MAKEKKTALENNVPQVENRPIESIPISRPPEEMQYTSVLQGKGINGLLSSSTAHGGIQIDAITHTGIMESDGVIITIDENAIQDISAQTFKTLIILLTEVTKQLPHKNAITADAVNKGRIVKISLKKYMEACELKDRKAAREQLNDAINALYAVSLEWYEDDYIIPDGKSRKVKITLHHRMRITDHTITEEDGTPVKNGVAEFRFSFDMAEYLTNTFIMPYPQALLSINTRYHPYSFQIGWKLCALQNMNNGTPTQNVTTVKTLLNSAKGIPRYSDLAQVGKIYERLIYPFDRDLMYLVEHGVLSKCWYYDSDGKQIESAQLGGLSYAEFSALSVHYEFKDYPDQTPRLETKRKRISAAISRNTAKKKVKKTGDGVQ